MRRILVLLSLAFLGALGCKHVAGKCDCGPVPGEASLYAPMQGYPTAPKVIAEPIAPPKELPKK